MGLFETLPAHRPLDAAQAEILLADCRDALPPEKAALMDAAGGFFGWVAEGSPFLRRLMRLYPDVLVALSDVSVEDYVAARQAACETEMAALDDKDTAMACLRHCRNRCALAIALADLADAWDVEQVTDALTRLADMAVRTGVDFLLRQAVAEKKLAHFTRDGLVVLALGKHGGQELNYSSDIDFVVYFTSSALPLPPQLDEGKFFITLVRELTALLQNPTAEGFVFRVDLRLRPDPGATPVALSTFAAETYYESLGQNWERAAMIKARIVAGDQAAGTRFLHALRPYVWRRALASRRANRS